jgi:hypothetical protein
MVALALNDYWLTLLTLVLLGVPIEQAVRLVLAIERLKEPNA